MIEETIQTQMTFILLMDENLKLQTLRKRCS